MDKFIGWIVIGGASGFILIVIFLHVIQTNYDPLTPQMSELALGQQGFLMLAAFLSFALSVFAAQIGLHQYKTPIIIGLFLVSAALNIVGAGVFRLDKATSFTSLWWPLLLF